LRGVVKNNPTYEPALITFDVSARNGMRTQEMVRGIAIIVVSIIHFTIGQAAFSQLPTSKAYSAGKQVCELVKRAIRQKTDRFVRENFRLTNNFAFTVEEFVLSGSTTNSENTKDVKG